MLRRRLNDVMLRLIGLQDDFAAQHTAASAPGDLGQELEDPFTSAIIGQRQANIGADDADQRDQRQVQALGDHLSADEDIGFLRLMNWSRISKCICGERALSISQRKARAAGKRSRRTVVDLLRAGAEIANPRRAAGGAGPAALGCCRSGGSAARARYDGRSSAYRSGRIRAHSRNRGRRRRSLDRAD